MTVEATEVTRNEQILRIHARVRAAQAALPHATKKGDRELLIVGLHEVCFMLEILMSQDDEPKVTELPATVELTYIKHALQRFARHFSREAGQYEKDYRREKALVSRGMRRATDECLRILEAVSGYTDEGDD